MYGAFDEIFLDKLRRSRFCLVWSARGVFPDTLLSGKCHHMKANQTRLRWQAEAGKNKIRDNWLDNEGGGENAFFGRKCFFHSRSDFAKSRSTIVQSLPKPSWLSSDAITTKNEFSLYRKSHENKDEKKGSEKLIKSPKNRLAGALSNKPLVRVYLT